MRRKDREITDIDQLVKIIANCDVVNVAFRGETEPYIVPLNFGFTKTAGGVTLYFHSAKDGKKADLIAQSPKVAFSMVGRTQLIIEEKSCNCTMKYESVCGLGYAKSVAETEKVVGMRAIMAQYSNEKSDIPMAQCTDEKSDIPMAQCTDEKSDIPMAQYSAKKSDLTADMLGQVFIWKIEVCEIVGKRTI